MKGRKITGKFKQRSRLPASHQSVFALPREERVRRGLERARRDPEMAVRVAVIEHGRHSLFDLGELSGWDRNEFLRLIWWKRSPRRFLRSNDGHSRIARELAEWWCSHADRLPPNWGFRLMCAAHLVAIDRFQFPFFSIQFMWLFVGRVDADFSNKPGWQIDTPAFRQSYLKAVRKYRTYILTCAEEVEVHVQRLTALESHRPKTIAGGPSKRLLNAAVNAAQSELRYAKRLRALVGLFAVHGRAGKDAEGAARGIFIRVFNDVLKRVERGLKTRFIAMLLDDMNFGTQPDFLTGVSSTPKTVQAILRSAAARRSN